MLSEFVSRLLAGPRRPLSASITAGAFGLLIGLLLAGPVAASEVGFGVCDGSEQILSYREVAESGQSAVARIGIRKSSGNAAGVFYKTEPITAEPGEDYEHVTGAFLLSEVGQECRFIDVPILDDDLAEGDERFRLLIAVSPEFGAQLSGPDSVEITIEDDEGPLPGLRVTKTDTSHVWSPEDPLIRYTISVVDDLNRRFIELYETVPVNTTLVPEESDFGWECVPGPGEGSECVIKVLPLSSFFEPTSVDFSVRVDAETPPGFEIFNSVAAEYETTEEGSATELTGNVFPNIAALCSCLLTGSCPGGDDQRVGSAGSVLADSLTLFRLRDRVLRDTAGGRRAVKLFYDHGVDLASAAFATPAYLGKFRDVLLDWLPVFRALTEGRGDEVTISSTQAQGMSDFFEDLRPLASQRLLAAIDQQLPRLDLDTAPGLDGDQMLARLNRLGCQEGDHVLCLNDGRFRVEVEWQDFDGNTGKGHVRPMTDDTGSFWFFDSANLELVVKVLDGRGINGRFWVFYGALSNVAYELTVTDTATGVAKTYSNPAAQFASSGDTDAFDPGADPGNPIVPAPGAPSSLESPRSRLSESGWSRAWSSLSTAAKNLVGRGSEAIAELVPAFDSSFRTTSLVTSAAGGGACQASSDALCLNEGRFRVEVEWQDFEGQTGQGRAVPTTDDTGTFWFFGPENVELIVKVLDGRGINGRFWVLYGALSNVGYEISVTDTVSGAVERYRNPPGRFASFGDTSAF